jgi:hypothetical protein
MQSLLNYLRRRRQAEPCAAEACGKLLAEKKLRLLAEGEKAVAEQELQRIRDERELTFAQNQDLREQLVGMRRQKEILAKTMAMFFGNRTAPGEYQLILPRHFTRLPLGPTESVLVADHGNLTHIVYRDSRNVFCEAPIAIRADHVQNS